jgi:predicted dehydrogenase
MHKPMRTVQCGIGGYGHWYLDRFFDKADAPLIYAGFVDPFPQGSNYTERIQALGLPIYDSLEAFYARHDAELAILASPIQAHCPQTVLALEHGSHVLTEKPLCASLADAQRMIAARDRAERVVAVGYQDSFTPETHALKNDIAAGRFGRPLRWRALAAWPRSRDYYERNGWAGRIRDDRGQWILDSPVNNAVSHYLHLMFYLLGPAPHLSAVPAETRAALARAHAIENYDTAVVQCRTTCDAQILFVASHAAQRQAGPNYVCEFENGVLRYENAEGVAHAAFADGQTAQYGRIAGNSSGNDKVLDTIAAIREGRPPLCGIEAALSQTACMLAAQESGMPAADFPADSVTEIKRADGRWLCVEGLDDQLQAAYDSGALPDGSVWSGWRAGPAVRSVPT